MKLGEPIDLSAEELQASQPMAAAPDSAPVPAAVAESRLGEPVDVHPDEIAAAQTPASSPKLGTPVDPLDDFEVFDAMESAKEQQGYDPADPGLAAKVWHGVKDFVGGVVSFGSNAITLGDRMTKALFRGDAGSYGKSYLESAALGGEAAGRVLGNYKMIGTGTMTAALKGGLAIQGALRPEIAADMKRESRRATWDFLREARDVKNITGNFNRTLETIFPQALRGFASIPVDLEAAAGAATVLDPANFVPVGAAANWSLRAPLAGAVKAAEASVLEAGLAAARARGVHDAASIAARDIGGAATRSRLYAAGVEAQLAARAKESAQKGLATVMQRQALELEALQSRVPLAERLAGGASNAVGAGMERVGQAAETVAGWPAKVAGKLAPDSAAAAGAVREGIESGVRNLTGAFGAVPAVAGLSGAALRTAGRDIRVIGRLLSEAEGQLPFFRRVAKETSGMTSFGASLVDESGLAPLVTAGGRSAAAGVRGAPIAGALGFLSSGGDSENVLPSAGVGAFLGMAGAGMGQWRRYANPAVIRSRQNADISRYRAVLLPEQQTWFDKLGREDRTALASFAHAHPDLQIRFAKLGKNVDGFWYLNDDSAVAMVNTESKRPLRAIVAHEVGHHVAAHGLDGAIQRTLLGDEAAGVPGVYTLLGKDGRPMLDAAGHFQTTPEFQALKDQYNARISAAADRAGEPLGPRTDADIAREVFAEHAADFLLGTNPRTGETNLAAAQRAGSSRILRGLAGSFFGSNLPFLKRLAAKTGAVYGANGRVAGSELFGQLGRSSELTEVVRRYHTELAQRARPRALDDGESGGISYDAGQIRANPEILDKLFDASGDVARTPDGKVVRNADGSPRMLSPKEQDQINKALADRITDWVDRNPDAAAAAGVRKETRPKKGGGTEEVVVAREVPTPVLQELAADKRFNPAQIKNLEAMSRLVKQGAGGVATFFYQPAHRGGTSTKYRSLKGDWRTEAPYAIEVSKVGNIFFRTASREKLIENAQRLVKRGNAEPWANSLPDLVRDMDTYLANHAAGKSAAEGIGRDKRDVLNELFGVNLPSNAGANPVFDTVGKRSPIIFRSRRLDRINRLTPIEGENFPVDYPKVKANFLPAAAK